MAETKRSTNQRASMTITLDAETFHQYQLYSAAVTTAKVLPDQRRLAGVMAYALADWMESVGMGHIEDAVGTFSDLPTLATDS